MNRDNRSEEIQTGQAGDAGRRKGGEVAPLDPRLIRRPGRRMPAAHIGLLVGAALGAAAALAYASCCSPTINLAYHEGPGLLGGMTIGVPPTAVICVIVGASVLANVGWVVGLLIGLLRKGRPATDGEDG
jgi:hypothetical protein